MNTMTNKMMNTTNRTMTKGFAKRATMLALVSVMTAGTVMPAMAATTGGTTTGTTVSAESVSDKTVSVSSYAGLGQVTGLGYTVQSSTEYELSWNAVSGATGYEIYRRVDGSTKWIKVNTTTKTTHIAGSALTAGNKYYFRVRAYKTAGSSTTYGSYSSAISFTFGQTVKVTGVSLNASSATLKVGKTKTLKATITPSNATNTTVTWSSSNTSVAKVNSSGKVTAKKAGTATITVKTVNGKTATCKIKVKKAKTSGTYLNVSAAYKQLNTFRTTKGVWYWNSDNMTKTYFNKSGCTTLKKLTKNSKLEAVAKKRAKELAANYSHTRPNGTDFYTIYPRTAVAENIAYGQASAAAAITSWKEEDQYYKRQGHRRAMLSTAYNAVGIACYKVNGQYYWVMALGKM